LRSVRRASACAALACALLGPAGAAADLGVERAQRGGAIVEFKVVRSGGDIAKVKKFRFREVTVTCATGPDPNPFDTRSLKPHFGPFSVNRRGGFARTFTSNTQNFDGTTKIHGEFEAPRRAVGTLRIQGDYPDAGYEGCDTGRVDWAHRL
jgi:hypothetical protein